MKCYGQLARTHTNEMKFLLVNTELNVITQNRSSWANRCVYLSGVVQKTCMNNENLEKEYRKTAKQQNPFSLPTLKWQQLVKPKFD